MMGVLATVLPLMTVSYPIGTKQGVDRRLAKKECRGALNQIVLVGRTCSM